MALGVEGRYFHVLQDRIYLYTLEVSMAILIAEYLSLPTLTSVLWAA